MYFVDFLGKVLLPLFYCPIFFTLAYESFSKSSGQRIDNNLATEKEVVNKKPRYQLSGIKKVSSYHPLAVDKHTKEINLNLRLFTKGLLCLFVGLGLAYMTYTNLMWFIG